jgi:hypothetical protein
MAEKIGLTAKRLNTGMVKDWLAESTKSGPKEKKVLYRSKLAAFEPSEGRDAFVARVMKCVTRAFEAIDSSAESQEIIYWNLRMTKNLRREEIIDKWDVFIEGLQGIFGVAGASVFEVMLRRQLKREFDLTAESTEGPMKEETISDLLRSIARAGLESRAGP